MTDQSLRKLWIGILVGCAAGWGQTHTVTVRGIVKDGSPRAIQLALKLNF